MYDVGIIGGGWSGILACKYMLAEGLRPVVFEKYDDIGGIWNYSDDIERPSVHKSTITTSSRIVTEMSDYPMPADYPWFPDHPEILAYLKSYAKEYGLYEHIRFNRGVEQATKDKQTWQLRDTQGKTWETRNLVVCSGIHQKANDISASEPFCHFSGRMLHSSRYRKIEEAYYDQNILIYGGGESASDIAGELSLVAKKVYWVIPNGQWFINRYFLHKGHIVPVDFFQSRQLFLRGGLRAGDRLAQKWFFRKTSLNGMGIEEFKSQAPHSGSFFNKNTSVLEMIAQHRVVPKPNISAIQGKKISFQNQSAEEIDTIIACTGFQLEFPFFADDTITSIEDQYDLIFHAQDPSLATIGFVRPIFGSIPGIAEYQSMYAAKVFSGKISLPDPATMRAEIERSKSHLEEWFGHSSRRLRGLVEHSYYVDGIAKKMGIYPNYLKLFLRNPKKWWTAFKAPYHGCQFMLNDSAKHDYIFNDIYQRYSHDTSTRKLLRIDKGKWFFYALFYHVLDFFVIKIPRLLKRS